MNSESLYELNNRDISEEGTPIF